LSEEPDYILEPEPRSDAVVLTGDGIAVKPVALGLTTGAESKPHHDDLLAVRTEADDGAAANYAHACANGFTPVTHAAGLVD
jgi:hypothetical protein